MQHYIYAPKTKSGNFIKTQRGSRQGWRFFVLKTPATGAKTAFPDGIVIVLSSANLSDTNTLAEPGKVGPGRSNLIGIGKQFRHVFPPYSLTVLVLQAR